ncbi:hypothetical protein RKE38_03135 [Phycicoccus sp. M110.8]|uniref:hypothetical protein n=1 Tax=Phycicoccus sp. M110.8 TaxID=3075433 RepID=UPI0028FD5F5A|nr:hypothetical protein [Phycicoccus sp. M110.8]MDU0312665.1 hypothetical protein [Phycicoccus sp. M110.8]
MTAAVLLAAGALAVRAVSDPSPWLHLKVGQFLLDGGRFGDRDPWAPFALGHYEPTQWLPSVATAWLYGWWGLPAVAWTRAAGIITLTLVLLLALRASSRPWLALLGTGLALAGSWPALTERPQLAGFALLAVTVGAWWRSAHDGRPRWWLVPLTWLAACVHGVWSIGLGVGLVVVVGLAIARSFDAGGRTRLALCLLASLAATALTPLGPRLTASPFAVGGNARQFVGEWMASSARTPSVALTLVTLAVVFALWVRRGTRPEPWQLILWLVALAVTLVMRRTVPVGAVLAAFLVTEALEQTLVSRGRLGARGVGTLELRTLAVGALVGVLAAVPLAEVRSQHPVGVPIGLTEALRRLPSGTRLLSDGDMSGWVLFVAPNVAPVYDLRVEAYTPARIEGFIGARDAQPGWADYLRSSGTRAALLEHDAPLVSALESRWHWRTVATDDGYVLMAAS